MKIFYLSRILPLGLLILWSSLFAQPLRVSLEDVGQLLSHNPCTRGNFVQEKYLPSINRSLTSSGTFLITATEGIIWQTEKPYPSIMVVGRSHIGQGASPQTMNRMDTGSNRLFMEFSHAISAAFSGNIDTIRNVFHLTFSSQATQWQLFLEPKENTVAQMVKSIQLQGNTVLETVSMTEQNGSTITYTFSNHSFSQEPTEYERQLLQK